MFGNFFSKPTTEDLLKVLYKDSFDESDASSMLESVDINAVDNDGKSFLHLLCIDNKIEPLSWLVKNGINKELEDYYDETALALAIKNKSFDAFIRLLELGYDVDHKSRTGRTIVQESLSFGDLRYYHRMKSYVKNINSIDNNGRNILFDAVSCEDKSIIGEILALDIDKGLIDKKGKPALLDENVLEHIDVLKIMVDNGVDISLKDKEGNNLLYYLLKSESINTDIIDYAIENKIDVNAVNNLGNTVLIELMYILNEQSSDKEKEIENEKVIISAIDKLLEHEINVNIQNVKGYSALIVATKLHNLIMVKKLIESGSDVNAVDKNGNTALSIASIRGVNYKEIAKYLATKGAKINLRDINNLSLIDKIIDIILYKKNKKRVSTYLMTNVDENSDYAAILKEILSSTKIDLYSLNFKGEPYFFEPIVHGNIELTKFLINIGFHINQLDNKKLNVIYKLMRDHKTTSLEAQRNYHTSLKTVLDMRADVNARDSFGGNTVHKAILESDVQTVKMLINANADLEAKDKQGRNYFHNCVWKNKVQIMRVIHSLDTKLINRVDDYGVLPINYAAFMGHTDLVVEMIV